MSGLEFIEVVHQGYFVTFSIRIKLKEEQGYDNITINNDVQFEARIKKHKTHGICRNSTCQSSWTEIYLKCVNLSPDDSKHFSVEVTCENMNLENSKIPFNIWHQIHAGFNLGSTYFFMTVRVLPELKVWAFNSLKPSLLQLMLDDIFTDFNLTCKDGSGSVSMHKPILAAASHTFMNLLTGSYHTQSFLEIDIPGVSKSTLQQLKSFIYLGELPTESYKPLLCLCAQYNFDKLEQICANKIADTADANSVLDEFEFAFKFKSMKLVTAILYRFQDCSIKVFELEKVIQAKNDKHLNGQVDIPSKTEETGETDS